MKRTLKSLISITAIVGSFLFTSCAEKKNNEVAQSTNSTTEKMLNSEKNRPMKVLLINGSPNEFGSTFTALSEVAKTLNQEGIETEIIQIGKGAMQGCTACRKCRGESDKCIYDDLVNEVAEKAKNADGFVFGSPVYYASANGSMSSFLDRLFYSQSKYFAHKPGAAVVAARRAGTTASLDQLNKYFTINQMPVVSSQYWNMVYGNNGEEVKKDLEGMQIMRTLGRNMAWLIKSIEAGRQAGIELPEREPRVATNFIR
jgi:multimeric flavodoxin WrbA